MADPEYMLSHCPKSCHVCGNRTNGNGTIATFYGVPQRVLQEQDKDLLKRIDDYMMSTVLTDKVYETILDKCRNKHEYCTEWSSRGECDANPQMMKVECAPSCFSCHQLLLLDDENDKKSNNDNIDPVCVSDPNADVWKQLGDLERAFRKIIYEYGENVTILSGPLLKSKTGPYLLTIDNFLSPEECDYLVQVGHSIGYDPSIGVVKRNEDGTLNVTTGETFRTSKTAWCHSPSCYNEETMKVVQDRIASLTGTPATNAQYMQLIKYEVGEYYKYHHDFDDPTLGKPPGPRILTVFIYLNDVPAGGGTRFDLLNITVTPLKGRAVIWPSVAHDDYYRKDPFTYHQGMPVEEGQKYALNQQVHMRDYRRPHSHDCAH